VRSLSSISQAWSIAWNALWRMRNGRFHDRIRLPSPALYARELEAARAVFAQLGAPLLAEQAVAELATRLRA
jgi:hypothetical protein